ncbi:MAG: hypothetical protein FJ303_21465 [Planctomycetes bacterium]|nr:hypothetical protein [Planctomycetota bacterium]
MPTRMLIAVLVLTGGVIALAGAWNRQSTRPAPVPEIAFVPQDVELDADLLGTQTDAGQLLQMAIAKLDPAKTTWLKTKIRQAVSDGTSHFVSEALLQRGPNHCARLEMTIKMAGCESNLTVVSDGDVVAQIRQLPGIEPKFEVQELPDGPDSQREAVLNAKSCGGPAALLRQLHEQMRNGRLQTGRLKDRTVIRIHGDLDAGAKTSFASSAHTAVAYLDTKTLWPCRLEWWGIDSANAPRLISCMDFEGTEVNCPLSADECMRVFSYQAESAQP